MTPDHEPMGPTNEHDALNAYLDRLAGQQDERSAPLSPEMRGTVDRLFALAAAAERDRPAFHTGKDPTMTTPASITLPAFGRPDETGRAGARRHRIRHWTQPLQMLSTAALVVLTVGAVIFAAMNGDGHHNGQGGDGGVYGAVPLATVPSTADTSSLPYPTAAECAAQPRGRAEMARLLQGGPPASVSPEAANEVPDGKTTDAILATYRQWQACSLKGLKYAFSPDLMTDRAVWEVFYGPGGKLAANHGSITSSSQATAGTTRIEVGSAPATGTEINQILDAIEGDVGASATPEAGAMAPATTPTVAVPGAGTQPTQGLTIFAEDVRVSATTDGGKTRTARATAYWVDLASHTVIPRTPMVITFMQADGRWRISGMEEQFIGG